MNKAVLSIHANPRGHWVGDGFPVRNLFSYDGLGQELSPFLLLDYAGPLAFEPAKTPRGVGEHPHRGFETVTIVYQGEVAHRDSAGNAGLIGPGDVQWMTAAGGVLHEEFHSPEFTRNGGALEMAQLWVNLPAKDKMSPPRYQTLESARIPDVPMGDSGRVRVIAGAFDGARGPAHTFSSMNVWDVRVRAGKALRLTSPPGHTAAIAVLHGSVSVNGSKQAGDATLVVLDRAGDEIRLEAAADTTLLLLSGEPIPEPIVGYGPFVMNSSQEIQAAVEDFRRGKFGRMPELA
ncbi:MAG TPA: pirin family protein [Steroidobacteraceae bacterium]|jgi:hypothetical protein|nr:pirin family protein [Steroidobacteraceae bacterium]